MENSAASKHFIKNHRLEILMGFLSFLLIFIVIFIVITDKNNEPMPVDESGFWQKHYALYQPMEQAENVTCDLYYRVKTAPPTWTTFGTQKVDIWRSYELVEQDNGPYVFEYTKTAIDYSAGLYKESLAINYGDAVGEALYFASPNAPTDSEGNFYVTEPGYFFTYVVKSLSINDKRGTSQEDQSYRDWTIHAYAVIVTTLTRVSLQEYVFHKIYDIDTDADDYLYARMESQALEAAVYEL